MIREGILNPHILDLLARVRHTNTVVIADRGFPYWPTIETIDISLCDDIPKISDVLKLIMPRYQFGKAFMAEEFKSNNSPEKIKTIEDLLGDITITFEPHEEKFKKRIPDAIGLVRTGDTTQYGNIILESA